jgi:[protein-PII] uridylyltransferase
MAATTMDKTGVVGALKDALAAGRKKVEELHRSGALGVQVSSAFVDLYDRAIGVAYQEALEGVAPADRAHVVRELAVVAVGGYGRGDLAPYSDIDLLFLLGPRSGPVVKEMVSRLVRDLWDLGLKLSQSVRTAAESIAFARNDMPHRTALLELRLLAGHEGVFAELQRRTQRLRASTSLSRYLDAVVAERMKEHRDDVASVNLLEPNVKKSPGGLRDLHLLRWIAMGRYEIRDPEMLRACGILGPEDMESLANASEFLYRIRHELHFHAGSAQDVLTRDEQVRISKWLGFENQGALFGVERFMQHYYRQTTALHDLVVRFAERARRPGTFQRVLNRLAKARVEEHFDIDRETIAFQPEVRPEALGKAEVLLRLFDLARERKVAVASESLERARAAASKCDITPEARRLFLEIMTRPRGLGGLVRNLHRTGLLGRFIPAFEHARCLMQFNQYHKYTVDEHSIRALEAATLRAEDRGPLGDAYREIRRKDVLHLAVLLHDIGKGHEEDHSEVGKRIAEDLGALVGLGENEARQLVFLVHKHLLMAHTAFRRDVEDRKTILQFVRGVGTIETLRMLYLLTAADTEAVAPGEFSSWKESLLTQLYVLSSDELAGTVPEAIEKARADELRAKVTGEISGGFDPAWLEAQLATLPLGYLRRTSPATIAHHLEILKTLGPDGVRVEAEYQGSTGITQYTVFTRDSLIPGIFSKLAGVLAAERFQIVDAQITTRADGLIIDSFRCIDTDHKGEPPQFRRRDVADRIEQVLRGQRKVESLFAAHPVRDPRPSARPIRGTTQIEIDNDSSDHYTVVEVFAEDRLGLLYAITRTLFEHGLSISSAKISTSLDQIVDVFYVSGADGQKLTEQSRVEALRRSLVEVIEARG